jgi:hypothetical protein
MIRRRIMALENSIIFRLATYKSAVTTLTVLRASGWTSRGPIIYFTGWDYEELEEMRGLPSEAWEDVRSVLEERERKGLIVAIGARWNDTAVGCDFRLESPSVLDVWIDAGGPGFEGQQFWPDFSWYLARILLPLQDAGYRTESIICEAEIT